MSGRRKWSCFSTGCTNQGEELFYREIFRGNKSCCLRKQGCIHTDIFKRLTGIRLIVTKLMEWSLEQICSMFTDALYLLCALLVMILILPNALYYNPKLLGNTSDFAVQQGFFMLDAYLTAGLILEALWADSYQMLSISA